MAEILVNQTQVLQDMSALLGENSVPNPIPAVRETFIQRALERVYRAYNFDLAAVITTLSLVNGKAALPVDVDINDPILDIRIKNDQPGKGEGGDFIFTKVPYTDQDEYGPSDYVYWVTGQPGNYTMTTAQSGDSSTANAALTIYYKQIAPTINASIGTPFPSSMVLARGALVYYRASQDPYMDVSQLDALFKDELEEVIATQIRNQANKPARTRASVMGTFIGDVDQMNVGAWDNGANL